MVVKKLALRHAFAVAKLMKKVDSDKCKSIVLDMNAVWKEGDKSEKTLESLGVKAAFDLFVELGTCENELADILTKMTDCKKNQILDWGFEEIKDFIKGFMEVNTMPDIQNFLASAIPQE